MKKAVFILSKENCSKCEQAKKELAEQGHNVIEIPIETLSKEAKQSIVAIRKAFGVERIDLPLILDSKIYSGYKKSDWE
ncbi:MAG TPA: hypothetical protein PK466_01555 [Thermotogota bacterium]|nr:hypothetical protein [Thermotogota bacterium]HPJ87893.1 hypothetical protein [Thermotogota bacterium]HPR94986.1 hypothetical protein [Thermotogota bacterium]